MGRLEELVECYLVRGDEEAIEEVVRRTRPRLLGVARRITPGHAEDCVQTAYLSLARKRGASLAAPVWPWLVRAVVRIAYRHKARDGRQRDLAARLATAREPSGPTGAAAAAEEGAILRSRVDRLPGPYRDVVVLHYLEGLTTVETARLLGLGEANVRKRLQRARALLRSSLPASLAWSLLALPWLARDALPALGGTVMKKKAIVAGVVLLLVAGGVAVVSREAGRTASQRTVPNARSAVAARTADGDAATVAPAPPAVPSGPHLTGRVLGPDGAPVAGARVLAFPADHGAAVHPERIVSPVTSATSDAAGRFAVPLGGDSFAWSLFAAAPGLAPGHRDALAPGADVTLELAAAAHVRGTVMDLAGRPVPGARVTWRAFYQGIKFERAATADRKGVFRLDGIVPRGTFVEQFSLGGAWFFCVAEGFAPLVYRVKLPPAAGETRNLVLTSGATLNVRVVDADARPVAGARVVVRWNEQRPQYFVEARGSIVNPFHGHPLLEARTDARGRCRFARAPAVGFHDHEARTGVHRLESLWIEAAADGFAPGVAYVRQPAAGAAVSADVRLSRACALAGRVVDGAGRPVPVADVAWTEAARSRGRRARPDRARSRAVTDAEGRYRLERVPLVDSVRVTASSGRRAGDAVARPESGVAPDVVIRDTRPYRAAITVVDDRGRPVAGVKVYSRPRGLAQGWTDADGRTVLRFAAPPEKEIWARVFSPAHVDGFTGSIVPAVAAPEVRVVLSAGRALTGRVAWSDGRPAEGAQVWAFNGAVPVADARKKAFHVAGHEERVLFGYGSGTVSADGSFLLEHLPAPPYHLRALFYRPGEDAVDVVAEGVARDGVALTLPGTFVPPPRTVVEGEVVDAATGRRVPVFHVFFRHPNRGPLPVRLVEPGVFRYEGVPPGTYRMQVTNDEYMRYTREDVAVAAGADVVRLTVELERGTTIRGTITNESGVDLTGATVVLAGGRSGPLDNSGVFVVEKTLPGSHPVSLAGPPGRRDFPRIVAQRDARAVVPAGAEEVRFDFTAIVGGLLLVDRGDPKPAPGLVEVLDAAGNVVRATVPDFAGPRYAWPLPPGRYRVRTDGAETEVEVVAGEMATAKFEPAAPRDR